MTAPTTRSCSTVARAASRASRDNRWLSVSATQAIATRVSTIRTPAGGATLLPRGSRQYRCVGIGLWRIRETELLLRRGLDRGDEQLEVERDQVDVGDRNEDVTTDHDSGIENAIHEIAQDEIARLEIVAAHRVSPSAK